MYVQFIGRAKRPGGVGRFLERAALVFELSVYAFVTLKLLEKLI